ncbi:MAG: 50S ribosomal protein L20 [Alphaproteobacteria bacterium]|jgi:large subunit ribosomal protein L20|nr:50S ribosomal protein L20 [Alphaproteobacteria bacterium]NBR30826.1 50S ribosomal protein L20 [Sphingomonadaceae bacterium]NBU78105.1 50S ribosomal protein L20 [Sphingomonadaceae bacterium]NCA00985.1 50S ribosomal protein L20 [Sphingomonadaceae bacterium]
MSRIKRGTTTHAKHKRILKDAKGYYGRRKNTIRIARQAVEKAGQYAYRDRKAKKRTFRALWIQRINAAVRAEGLTYGLFMHGLKLAGVELDRKVLADLAMNEAGAFSAIIAQAKAALPKAA